MTWVPTAHIANLPHSEIQCALWYFYLTSIHFGNKLLHMWRASLGLSCYPLYLCRETSGRHPCSKSSWWYPGPCLKLQDPCFTLLVPRGTVPPVWPQETWTWYSAGAPWLLKWTWISKSEPNQVWVVWPTQPWKAGGEGRTSSGQRKGNRSFVVIFPNSRHRTPQAWKRDCLYV